MHAITNLSADLTETVSRGLTNLRVEVVKLAADPDATEETRRERLAKLQRDVGALLDAVREADEAAPAPAAVISTASVDTLERAIGQLASHHFGPGGSLIPFLEARGDHELAECVRKAGQ